MRNTFAHLIYNQDQKINDDIFDLLYAFALAVAYRVDSKNEFVTMLTYFLCAIEAMTSHIHLLEGFDPREYDPRDFCMRPLPPIKGYESREGFYIPLDNAWLNLHFKIIDRLDRGRWFKSNVPPYLEFPDIYANIESGRDGTDGERLFYPVYDRSPYIPTFKMPVSSKSRTPHPEQGAGQSLFEQNSSKLTKVPEPPGGEGKSAPLEDEVPTAYRLGFDHLITETKCKPRPYTWSTGFKVLTDANGEPLLDTYTLIEEIAHHFAVILPDPIEWCSIVIYLLKNMAFYTDKTRAFESALDNLCRLITRRLNHGHWE